MFRPNVLLENALTELKTSNSLVLNEVEADFGFSVLVEVVLAVGLVTFLLTSFVLVDVVVVVVVVVVGGE